MSQQGQITDRFTKAIAQLGDKTLAVRLGGIYALERIARDSESDHWAVMEVLTAFVREPTAVQKTTPDELPPAAGESSGQGKTKVPADIQAILTVLGRRTRTYGKGESQRLDLSRAQLEGANLRGAQLQGADLRFAQLQHADLEKAQHTGATLFETQLEDATLFETQLTGANLRGAQLTGANLGKAQLTGAFLRRAQLTGARLEGAQLTGATLSGAQLAGANLEGAQLMGAHLSGAQLTGAFLRQDQINTACVDEQTILPEGLTRPAPCPANP